MQIIIIIISSIIVIIFIFASPSSHISAYSS